jgi:hypothetical protein
VAEAAADCQAQAHRLAEGGRLQPPFVGEAPISHFKPVIGDALRSRTRCRRALEVAIAVTALNRMIVLGRPEAVRIVNPRHGRAHNIFWIPCGRFSLNTRLER